MFLPLRLWLFLKRNASAAFDFTEGVQVSLNFTYIRKLTIDLSMEKRSLPDQTARDDKFLNALAEAFRLQEAILNTTELAIISVSPSGVITSFNHAAENLLGYPAEDLIGKSTPLLFFDLDHVLKRAQELSEELKIPIEPVFDVFTAKPRLQRITYREEWTFTRKNSTQFPALMSVAALRDEHEVISGYVAIITDISDIKMYDERARASEQKFRLLAENIPGVIYLRHHAPPFAVIYVNNHIEKITGYPAADFLSGKINVTQLYHPEDTELIRKQVDQAVAEKTRYHLRYRLQHRSGDWRWIDEVGIGVFADGNITMLEGFVSDITAQKEAEDKLQHIVSENLRVFNNAVTLNVVAGFDGYFKRVSLSWTTILGWSEIEL